MLSLALALTMLLIVIPATPALAAESVTVDPEEGEIGDTITIEGTGFSPSTDTIERSVLIYFTTEDARVGDIIGDDVTVYRYLGEEVVSTTGTWDTSKVVPDRLTTGSQDVTGGTYYIVVTLSTQDVIRVRAEFTVIAAEIDISPTKDIVGAEVEITGTGFNDRETLTIEYDNDEIDIERDDTETDRNGEFISTILVPESYAGEHTITATDETGSTAEVIFTVKPALTTVDPTSGAVGSTVSVSGNGFGKDAEVKIYVQSKEATIVDADSVGTFETSFEVPDLKDGAYDLKAEDEDGNIAKVKFTVTPAPAQASLSAITGNIGTNLTISGTRFTTGGTVTIMYDGAQIGTAITDANGVFTYTFPIPKSKAGANTVTASDGTNTKTLTFTMESTAPPVPTPLKPEMGVKATSPVSFDWGDVNDPSGVTYTLQVATDNSFSGSSIVLEKTGLTRSEYTLAANEKLPSTSKEAPYYWRVRAVDGASNAGQWTGAGSFSTGTSFSTPQWSVYVFFIIGALLLGALGFWMGRKTAYF